LVYAYDFPVDLSFSDDRIVGGPPWIYSEIFDIQAKADDSVRTLSKEDARLMLQSLLEDRFKLKAHLGTREAKGYNLVVAKGGLKMSLSKNQKASGGSLRMNQDAKGRTLVGVSVPLEELVTPLGAELDVPILDKTGTEALYDFEIHLGPVALGPELPTTAAEISKALEEVGLRLELARSAVPVLVIESVQRPTSN
jgi:uncharacterized protein (TIGR03435 family)